jgi:hypothetical protein
VRDFFKKLQTIKKILLITVMAIFTTGVFAANTLDKKANTKNVITKFQEDPLTFNVKNSCGQLVSVSLYGYTGTNIWFAIGIMMQAGYESSQLVCPTTDGNF